MIYICGDTHGDIDFAKLKKYFSRIKTTRNDYLIILGDAAIVWSIEENYSKMYEELGLTILYIDGNHENFDLINTYPVVEYLGAKCHKISDYVYHILRGEILNINGITFFCMGGASSTDREYRTEHISWWVDENIKYSEIENALSNLEKVNYKVNYFLSHAGPSSIVRRMFLYPSDGNTDILEELAKKVDFDHYYFGHYHEDKTYYKYRCLYWSIAKIEN